MLSAASTDDLYRRTDDPPLYSGTNCATQIWTIWNQQQYQSYQSAGTNNSIWGNWIGGNLVGGLGAQTSLQQSQYIWAAWVNANNAGTVTQSVTYPPPTEEDLARQRDILAEEKAANERAAELLLAYLDDDQKRTWRENKVFDLVSERKKRYRIKRGISHNVTELNEHGKEIVSYCAHPDGVPVDDVVLTQVLALKYAEDHFLRVANRRQLAA